MYENINVDNVNKIKSVLKNADMNNEIEISIDNMDLIFKSDSMSKTLEENTIFFGMEPVYLMYKGDTSVLKINGKEYDVFFNIGEWGYETRIPKSHLVLGTSPVKFGSNYFCQIELSQAIEDKEYIYIIKNIDKLAGEGAISRLNNGLGSDKKRKHERRKKLIQKINAEIVSFNKNEWLCVYKIDKNKLNNKDCHEEILFNFMQQYLLYALAIESIIFEEQ